MDHQISRPWLPIPESLDERMKIITDSTHEKRESMINPYDLPGDDEKYLLFVFVERLKLQEALEIIELAANNPHLENRVANEIPKKIRNRLELVN